MADIQPNAPPSKRAGMIDSALYREILGSMPIPCVDVVIPSSQGILLVRRAKEPAKDQWWIPGGRVFKGETLAECSVRKAREEVGVQARFERIVHVEETMFDTGPWDIPVHSVNVCILLTAVDGQLLKLDRDHAGTCWYDGSSQIELHGYVRRCLEASGVV